MSATPQPTPTTKPPTTDLLSSRLIDACLLPGLLIIVTVILTGIGWGLFIAFRGLAWPCAVAWSYLGAIGWLILVPPVLLAVLETSNRLRNHHQASATGAATDAPTARPPRGRSRLVLCAGSAAVILSGNLCLNIAAARIDTHYRTRQQQGVNIYKNHDLAKLVGQCVRLAILRHASGLSDPDERRLLEAIAAIAPAQWQAMTDGAAGDGPDPRVLALADAKLTKFIQEPRAEALHTDEWASLLTDWRTTARASALPDATLRAAAATIARDFGITLREALKADFEKGGKAWAAMQLDIALQLLNRTPASAAAGNEQISAAQAAARGLLADDARGLPALHRIVLDVKQAQDAHARTVAANFDHLVVMLGRMEAGIDAGLIADVIGALSELVSNRGSDLPAHDKARIDSLLRRRVELVVAQVPAEKIPPDIQAAIADIFRNDPPVVRFAALARVGLEAAADELAREIERTTAGLSEADRYEFFVARGDRFWNDNDHWNAATWYAQAMAIRVDDPAVVCRAAESTVLAPGTSTYTRDVQLAQSWVERCLIKVKADPAANVIVRARLLVTLARTLSNQGKATASISPAREALRILEREGDAPAGETYALLADAASSLGLAGVLADAAAAADRAVAAAETLAGPESGTAALALSSRASIRLQRGDLPGAEADIQKSIDWGEQQSPSDERSLAINYATRASIRLQRGDLPGAEADIQKSIDWGEQQSPRDERSLAIRYATRATIRQVRGNLPGAEADIQKSIDWGEQQSPRDETSLAILYSRRAEIRQVRGDLPGAEADIQKSIDWEERQSPRNERSLAIWYSQRATIRQVRGDLPGAEADIQKSIDWGEQQSPRDERSLAIRYATRARIRLLRGDLPGARTDIDAALAWFLKNLPDDTRSILRFRDIKALIEAAEGR